MSSLLYDQNLNATIESNGTEELTSAENPHWFAGTGHEIGRGVRNAGTTLENLASVTGYNQMQVTAGMAAAAGQTDYAQQLHDAAPPDPADFKQREKPDAQNSGAAAVIIGNLFEQIPTIGAALVNPAAGFTLGAATGDITGQQDATEMGITGPAAKYLGALTALEMGIGGAMPGIGGIGEGALLKYGSRFVVGGTANEALSEAGRYSRAAVLDGHGYTAQAQQLRQWDLQAAASNFILGGIFNLAGGRVRDADLRVSRQLDAVTADAAIHTVVHDNYVTESAPGLAVDVPSESAHVRALDAATESIHSGRAVDVSPHFEGDHAFLVHGDLDAGVTERQALAGNTTDRLAAIQRAADEQFIPDSATSAARPETTGSAETQHYDLLRQQIDALVETHPELAETVAPHIDRIQSEHAAAHAEAEQFEIAAACAVIHGN